MKLQKKKKREEGVRVRWDFKNTDPETWSETKGNWICVTWAPGIPLNFAFPPTQQCPLRMGKAF
jgi:hypothetical protein